MYVAIIAVLLASIAAPMSARSALSDCLRRMPPGCWLGLAIGNRWSSRALGGILLAGADWIGRVVMIPKELPSGIVTALLGAPYLLYLMGKPIS